MTIGKILLSREYPKITQWLVWAILGLMSYLFTEIYGDLAQDDAYITFRYARNLAMGRGFVYNEGEWVLGTTTPLYTLLLAFGCGLARSNNVLDISKIINCLALWISAGLLFELRKSLPAHKALFLSLLYITNPFMRNFVGMESYLILCLIVLTIWAYQSGKNAIAGILCGLAILGRYEMVFLPIILGLRDYIRTRRVSRWLLPGIVPVLIWLTYATTVFGSPIPLSASAKLLAPQIPFLYGAAIYWYQIIQENPGMMLLIILVINGLISALILKRSFNEYNLIMVFCLVYLIAATLFAGSFPWYYAPLLPGFVVVVIFGVNDLTGIIEKCRITPKTKLIIHEAFQSAILGTLVIVQLLFWIRDFTIFRERIGDDRYFKYSQVAQWLVENSEKEKSLATFEIGYLGYITDMRIIDLAGLVTPGLFPWVDEGAEESLRNAIPLLSPDYILIPATNSEQEKIVVETHKYDLVKLFPELLLFEKK